MCTYVIQKSDITGSGKGTAGWIPITEARVYYDHPFHMTTAHTLNIDFVNPGKGLDARVAVELTEESARALVADILAALEEGGAAHAES